jgi:iron complex outermembrane receptor protein
MYTLKAVQPVGDGTLTGYYDYSDRAEIDYQDLSKDIVSRRGADWDNFFPDWNAAIAAANACPTSGTCDDAYWNASGLRKDHLGYLALDLPVGEAVEWKTTAYGHHNRGQGLWGTPYVATPGGAPISVRSTEYYLKRLGVLTSLSWKGEAHEVEGGVWYETNDFTQARRFYGEPSSTGPTRDFTELLTNSFRTDWEYDFDTESYVFHLQDTWSVNDELRLNFGFKSVNAKNTAHTIVGDVKNGTIKADEPFLRRSASTGRSRTTWSGSDLPRAMFARSRAAARRGRSARRRRASQRSRMCWSPRRRTTTRPACACVARRSRRWSRRITSTSRIASSASIPVRVFSVIRRCSQMSAA